MFSNFKIFIIFIILNSICFGNNISNKIYSVKELDNIIRKKRYDDLQKINRIIRNIKPWRLFKQSK